MKLAFSGKKRHEFRHVQYASVLCTETLYFQYVLPTNYFLVSMLDCRYEKISATIPYPNFPYAPEQIPRVEEIFHAEGVR